MLNEEKERKQKEEKFIQKRTVICLIIVSLVFFGFVTRLFSWQIVQGDYYKDLAQKSTAYTVTTEATRGEILDCNGEGLAVNKSCYRIELDKLFLDEETADQSVLKLIDLMEKADEEWIDVLPITLSQGEFVFKKDSAQEIKTLKSEAYLNLKNKDSAQLCMELLRERYNLTEVKNKEHLRNLASVHYNMEKQGFSNTNPYIFAEDISSSTVAIISENTQNITGIEIETYLERYNPVGDIAPHILGALGSITQTEYEEKTAEGKEYGFNDVIGKFGLEYSYEDRLKGTAGEKIVQKNSQGSVTDVVQTVDAKPGETLYLTIDSNLQKTANEALAQQIKEARANGKSQAAIYGEGHGEDCETGAVVMLSVKDFSVLAAASYPTYDLNKYSQYGDYYVKLATDENSPMYNRAFVGSFAPGSVYKPCVACAGLEEGVITSATLINCTKYYNYYSSNPVACMGYHTKISLTTAVAKSCNFYFAEVGRQLGIDTMYLYAEKFGLGEKTGLEVAEGKGILAGRDSTTWLEGNTVQAAIGQSDNAFTPVQLATYTATLANNGVRYRTHLVKEIRNYQRDKITYRYDSKNPEVVDTVGVSSENLKKVQQAMRAVVSSEGGTANAYFGDYPVKVAAKTGTAENAGSDHTVFICYAPYEDPEVALAVVLEHGASGKYSMTVAKEMLDEYFGIKKSPN